MRVAVGAGLASAYEFRKLALAPHEIVAIDVNPPPKSRFQSSSMAVLAANTICGQIWCPSMVPEPYPKHLTQPHQDANRSLQIADFAGSLASSVHPSKVPSLALNQRVCFLS